MPVHKNMVVFPRVPRPTLLMYESWEEFAEGIGATKYGADWLTATYLVIQGDHVGTHLDGLKHIRGPDAPGPEGIPLEYCFSDGVVLDFRHKDFGAGISAQDIDKALEDIGYEVKERDIVLIETGASAYNNEERYLRDNCGMTEEATRHLISKGVRLMGIDAPTSTPPYGRCLNARSSGGLTSS
jgi:kynurenine formamidase